jgi:hypothetical protein
MKKYLLSLCALSFVFAINTSKAQTHIISASADDFETWSADAVNASAKDPNSGGGSTGWQCLNLFSSPFTGNSPVSVFKDSTTVHSGSYSCKIVSVKLTNTSYGYLQPYYPHDTVGIILLGQISGTTFNLGAPFTHRLTSLSFWYQYTPGTGATGHPDTAYCEVVLSHMHHTLGAGYLTMNAAASWTQANVNLLYDSASGAPDTILAFISSSSLFKPAVGSVLIVDGVSVAVSTGLDEISKQAATVEVYPNPASSQVNLRISTESHAYTAKIFDVTGKEIGTYSIKNNVASINTEAYNQGLYICQVIDKDGNLIHVSKFSVVR